MYFSDYKEYPHQEISPTLFWEYDMKTFDFTRMIRLVVLRVIERGSTNDFYALFQRYGEETVFKVVKELPSLSDRNIAFISNILQIPLEELQCSKKTPWRLGSWNS